MPVSNEPADPLFKDDHQNIIQKKIKDSLVDALSLQDVFVTAQGNHFQIIALGDVFSGMSRLKRQQTIYAPLMTYITDKSIHAVSIKAYTPQEWAALQKDLLSSK